MNNLVKNSMKNFVNKAPAILLMLWPYIFFMGMLSESGSFFGVYCILTILLCVINVINAWTYSGEHNAKELGFWGMLIKLLHMPFYIVMMLMGAITVMSTMASSTAAGVPFVILFVLIIGFLFMITSSVYCAKAAMAAKDMGIMKKDTAMMMAICSFMFVGDVICAILIYSKIKNKTSRRY